MNQQFVQPEIDRIEMKYVSRDTLNTNQLQAFERHILKVLPQGFEVTLTRVEHIPRGPGGKAEIFICEV